MNKNNQIKQKQERNSNNNNDDNKSTTSDSFNNSNFSIKDIEVIVKNGEARTILNNLAKNMLDDLKGNKKVFY
jgi:hypothetical protein